MVWPVRLLCSLYMCIRKNPTRWEALLEDHISVLEATSEYSDLRRGKFLKIPLQVYIFLLGVPLKTRIN